MEPMIDVCRSCLLKMSLHVHERKPRALFLGKVLLRRATQVSVWLNIDTGKRLEP